MIPWQRDQLEKIADVVGTPFYVYDAVELRRRIADVQALTQGDGFQARFAMKSCPVHTVLKSMRDAGIWIDAVSGNECLRALSAGYSGGKEPPYILYTADVFRDNWKQAVFEEGILPNLGSPGMLDDLLKEGYRGPVGIRVNVGFGHGHVNTCDTGGPSSKHGIWWEDAADFAKRASAVGCPVRLLHTHVGSGPQQEELRANLNRIIDVFSEWIGDFSDVDAVSLGGGLPWNYQGGEALDVTALRNILTEGREKLVAAAGRPLRLEIEPGRYFVASAGTLVARVTDVKSTRSNEKGEGHRFVMVDAGFVDLVRPAMYGSYHRIEAPGVNGGSEAVCVAGPLCESGDVFTRGADELLEPRTLPSLKVGDLICLRDAGAYGYAMSSNYNSIGRPPQVWIDGQEIRLISRRETLHDLLVSEVDEVIASPAP